MTPTTKRHRKTARIPASEAKEGKSIRRVSPHDADRSAYANREQSWLAFNYRVLDQAKNPANPLLERVKFLAIVSSNLDEFFEIRVAGLIQQVDAVAGEISLDGLLPREQLKRVHAAAVRLVEDQYRCWHEQLVPLLAKEAIVFRTSVQLAAAEEVWVRNYFQTQVLPVLTPLAIDQAHPFPQIGNKTLNVLVSLDNPDTPENEKLMILLPVPRILPRIVQIGSDDRGPGRFIFLSEIIKLCAGALFPGYRVNSAHAFRITRNSDLYIDDEEAENLLKKIEEELRNLRRGATVRLEIEAGVDEALFTMLCGYLGLSDNYAFRLHGPLNLLRLMSLYEMIDRPDLKFPVFTPAELPALRTHTSIFDAIRDHELLLHHPYDSFTPVVEFVEQAARDPEVFAIKQTFYRTSGDSPIVRAMMDAAINGKQVTALVELKARFDEANNIHWARQMEEAGVHVVYGLIGHKTHCKCSLVVRREGDALRRYVHLGSGNYNPKTARLYTDLSFFTTDETITSEVAQLFNTLTGAGRSPEFQRLLVAPFNLHARIQEFIAAEAVNAAAGKPARIIAKMNKLVDQVTIDNLYAASQAGVKIDLIVRATCCLRPGVKGLSENIRVRSIVGRFLEHARVIYFENGGQPLVYCGSADWMSRNFFRRVETMFPINDLELRKRLVDDLLLVELRDNEDARELQPDGTYMAPGRAAAEPPFAAQRHFMATSQLRANPPVAASPLPAAAG